jgi:4-amino-4-deoxy-L-arabinose transferase-like glycosyltransferase
MHVVSILSILYLRIQKFKNYSKSILLPGILILVFGLSRIPVLDLPFFWDELGVYGQSVFYQVDNGIGILPSYLPPELSRGHPMLYVFSNSIFASVFGDNRVVLHAFNLLISCLLLGLVFRTTQRYFSFWTGILSITLLMVQPLFYAQSTLVLPEMMLACLVFGMWLCWIDKRSISYIIIASLAIWTKETAIVFPLAFCCSELTMQLLTRKPNWRRLIWTISPWISFFAFLLIQKQQNGWYFFPYHTSLMDFTPSVVLFKLWEFIEFLFLQQYRLIGSVFLLFGAFLSIKSGLLKSIRSNPAIVSIVWIITGMLLFSALNAYMNRYLLVLLPFFAILVSHVIVGSVPRKLASLSVLVMIILPLSFGLLNHKFEYDEDRNFKDQVKVTQTVVNELSQSHKGELVESNFPAYYALRDSRFGYFDEELAFELAERNDTAGVYVWMTPGDMGHPPPWKEVKLHFTTESGSAKGKIYLRDGIRDIE